MRNLRNPLKPFASRPPLYAPWRGIYQFGKFTSGFLMRIPALISFSIYGTVTRLIAQNVIANSITSELKDDNAISAHVVRIAFFQELELHSINHHLGLNNGSTQFISWQLINCRALNWLMKPK